MTFPSKMGKKFIRPVPPTDANLIRFHPNAFSAQTQVIKQLIINGVVWGSWIRPGNFLATGCQSWTAGVRVGKFALSEQLDKKRTLLMKCFKGNFYVLRA